VIRAAQAGEIETVRELFREYAKSIGNAVCFESFAREVAGLPRPYAPLLVARVEDQLVGCAGLREIGPGIGEMKRLYVKPGNRKSGLGRLLIERIIDEARAAGYRSLRLDTLPSMERAIEIYRAMGFREIPPYGGNPPQAICFELTL
jgi:ribosomal protein S18 acetylase RimI-like enzyme